MEIDVSNKDNICVGMLVEIVAEKDRATQELTRGYVKEIITLDRRAKKITVIIEDGTRGVVHHVVTKDELKIENFKFYNLFFYDKNISSVWDKKQNKYLVVTRRNGTSGKEEKVAFLFNDDQKAKEVISYLNSKDYMLRHINRNKPIVENFKTLDVEFFSINKDRKISYDRLVEWECKFKNIR